LEKVLLEQGAKRFDRVVSARQCLLGGLDLLEERMHSSELRYIVSGGMEGWPFTAIQHYLLFPKRLLLEPGESDSDLLNRP
jgi:hypothetical protein